ncbi:TetR/AcrR family transcriptional regulator [Nocardiopsis sp. NPDC049922]|uniref:TetR/AcrR family transcriptional regulator n=1 Tax=Nocardiopsis sp. NPDC049922 TaxID=3155157 RepID=UPI0033F7FF10
MRTTERRTPVRERLLETADRLFYGEGIHAVGIDRIIAESRVAKSTMYVHFRTKEELVEAYLRRRHAAIADHVESAVDQRSGGHRERVLAVFEVLDDSLCSPDWRGCPFTNAAAEYPAHEGVRSAVRDWRDWLHSLFDRLLGPRAEKAYLAPALVQLVDGSMTAAHLDRTTDAASVARRVAATLLDTAT